MNCIICGELLTGKQQKYCSYKCKQTVNLNANYEYQKGRGLQRKLEIVARCGGKCSMCGYAKNLSALVFHHLDPSQKDMKLDMRKLSNSKMETILLEVAKCVLLCANCHMEIHHPELMIDHLLPVG